MTVIAHPIDNNGNQTGPERIFSDLQWNNMVRTNGSKLVWKRVSDEKTHNNKPFSELITHRSKGSKGTKKNQNKKSNE